MVLINTHQSEQNGNASELSFHVTKSADLTYKLLSQLRQAQAQAATWLWSHEDSVKMMVRLKQQQYCQEHG